MGDGVRLSRLYLVAAWERPAGAEPAELDPVRPSAPTTSLEGSTPTTSLEGSTPTTSPPNPDACSPPDPPLGTSVPPSGPGATTSAEPTASPPGLPELLDVLQRFGPITEVHRVAAAGPRSSPTNESGPSETRGRPSASDPKATTRDRQAASASSSRDPLDLTEALAASPPPLFDLPGLLQRLWASHGTPAAQPNARPPAVPARAEPSPVRPSPPPPATPDPSPTQPRATPRPRDAQGLFDLPNLLERVLSMPATGSPSVHYAFARAVAGQSEDPAPANPSVSPLAPPPELSAMIVGSPESPRSSGRNATDPPAPAPPSHPWEDRASSGGWSARHRPYAWVCPACRLVNPPWSGFCTRCHVAAPSN
jgi:hypothetical protein